jgi:hypothetical protein
MRSLLATAALLCALAAPAASAKDGAHAHLLTPLPTHARPGVLITVRWTITIPGPHHPAPFGARGMFVTLIGPNRASTTATAQQNRPPYSVQISVPAGKIQAIRFGLRGYTSGPTGTHPAPIYFPLK